MTHNALCVWPRLVKCNLNYPMLLVLQGSNGVSRPSFVLVGQKLCALAVYRQTKEAKDVGFHQTSSSNLLGIKANKQTDNK